MEMCLRKEQKKVGQSVATEANFPVSYWTVEFIHFCFQRDSFYPPSGGEIQNYGATRGERPGATHVALRLIGKKLELSGVLLRSCSKPELTHSF